MKKRNILALALAAGLVLGGSQAYAAEQGSVNVIPDSANTNVRPADDVNPQPAPIKEVVVPEIDLPRDFIPAGKDTSVNTNVWKDTTPNTNVWPDTTPNTNVWPDTTPNPNVKPDPEVKPSENPEVKPSEKPEVKPGKMDVKKGNKANPKTGVVGISAVAGLAAASLAGIVATRKKNN